LVTKPSKEEILNQLITSIHSNYPKERIKEEFKLWLEMVESYVKTSAAKGMITQEDEK